MAVNETVTFDLDAVVEGKFGKGKVPRPIMSWLKRFIHQDHLNGILGQGYLGIEFLEKAIEYYDVHLNIEGKENLPESGRYTFVANHPLGGIDGVSVIATIGRKYNGNIVVPSNDLLMSIKQIAEYTIPVNKFGGQSADLIGQINDAFNSDRQVIIFPAGLCSRKIDGIVQDLPWKKTFVTKSVEYQRDVVPIYFDGRNSDFFYNLANACKWLGIKFNIAMLYLADEMLKNRHKTFNVTIGKPIPWQTFDHSKTPSEWAQFVKEIVYKLNIS